MQIGLSKIPFDGGDVLSLRHLPINFNPMFQIIGLTFSLITTAFAGYFPSRKAGKIDPVVIIRG
jgi:lipoprotein-releasing system permease protein